MNVHYFKFQVPAHTPEPITSAFLKFTRRPGVPSLTLFPGDFFEGTTNSSKAFFRQNFSSTIRITSRFDTELIIIRTSGSETLINRVERFVPSTNGVYALQSSKHEHHSAAIFCSADIFHLLNSPFDHFWHPFTSERTRYTTMNLWNRFFKTYNGVVFVRYVC